MGKYIWYENGKRCTTPEYRAWSNAKTRCFNTQTKDYWYYGRRGITMCQRWANSFKEFLKDMGKKPTKLHTLERKNTDQNYCKANCIWATRQHQAQNRNYCKITKQVAAAVRRMYLSGYGDQNVLAKEFGVTQTTISHILRGKTWVNAKGKTVFASQKYRNMQGEKNGRAKLTTKKVAKIKTMYDSKKYNQRQLSQMFFVSQATISRITRNAGWL